MTVTEEPTPLDRAHAVIEADPTSREARQTYYQTLLGETLYMPVWDEDGNDDKLSPVVLKSDDQRAVPLFDRAARAEEWIGERPMKAVEVLGAAAFQFLDGAVEVALNIGAPSGRIMPTEEVEWLHAAVSSSDQDQS